MIGRGIVRFALTALVSLGAAACSSSDAGSGDFGTVGGQSAVGGASSSGGSVGVGGKSGSGDMSSGGSNPTGGTASSQGGSSAPTGGTNATGGASTMVATGGTSRGGSGTDATQGGSVAKGGSATVGGASGGGSGKGGTPSGGGVGKGGAVASGGAGKGGTSGAAVGGTGPARGGAGADGGTTSGGAASGGSASGGTATGGSTGACTPTFADPPSNVSAWVNESWNDQLGANVKNRKAWLIDSAILGKGQINLCVRWGATTAPTAAVKTGMAAAVQKWFNDWFSQLADYGCFPYPTITTKVTGWAVKAGNTGWVSDLGSDVKIYTETDSDGEPKCSDSCSFFENWTHKFPNCPGGEAFHQDYWLWLDDSIGGGAAAVGGDWGLRMPVSNFVSSMGKSNLVIEHEMGHGFGFQDYYDWKGSTPAGGSLMIVGSTSSQTPTIGDTWLLRRTWKEMKTLRGW